MDSRLKRAAIRGGLIGVAFASMLATAATFNLFQPANGILKGSSSTYVTTAAVTGDIVSLWSGSCSNITYLRGDGTCATPPGTGGGTVNSVALTMPSGFSVGGSPVTNTGTLAVTTALSGVLKGTGSGFTTAVAADIVALFSTCSGTQYLGADGACHTSGTVSSVALADGSTSPIFTISGSPVTGSGTLTETLSTQAANLVLAGPTTGAAAQPTFRALVAADIPPISLSSGVTGSLPFASLTITSANVIGLWTGTCNSSSYLNGAGVCTVPSGAGTVTSVGLTAPTGFSVSGTPVTGSGTLALSYAGGQTANSFLATPNGTTGALSLRTIVAADLPGSITSNTSGNAATATALAAAGTDCTVNYAIGVTAGGNAICSSAIAPTMTALWTFSSAASTGAPTAAVGTASNQGGFLVGNIAASNFNANATSGDPPHAFELVNDNGSNQGMRLITYGATAFGPDIHFEKARGTLASPAALQLNDIGLSIGMRGYNGSVMTGSTIGIEGEAAENWDSTHFGSWIDFQIVPTGGVSGGNRNSVLQLRASSTASNPTFVGITTGNSGLIYMPVVDSAGTRFGYFGHANSGDASMTYESDSILNLVANNGVDRIQIDASHNLTYNSVAISTAAGANPTASVGTSAVNGSSTNFMRADAAPAISLTMSPTMTGNWTHTPASGVAIAINAPSATASATFTGAGTVPLSIQELSAAPGNVLSAFVGIGNGSLTGGSGINGDLVLAARTSNANWIDFVTGGSGGGSGSVVAHISGNGGLVMASPTGGSEGLGTVNATGLFVNGVPVITSASGTLNKLASAEISGTASTCTISYNGGGFASCAANGSGQWALTYTTSYFSTNAACTATGQNATVDLNGTIISSPSSSSVNVLSFNTTTGGLNATAVFNVICIGT